MSSPSFASRSRSTVLLGSASMLWLFGAGALQGETVSRGAGEPVANWDLQEITEIGRNSARFNGVAIPNGLPTIGSFTYVVEGSGSGQQTVKISVGAGFEPVLFSRLVTNLQCETSYVVWVHADNEAGSDSGGSRQFSTTACGAAPVVQTGQASNLTSSSATFNGQIDTGGLATEVRFDWGLAGGSLINSTPLQLVPGSSGTQSFAATVGGLDCGASYVFSAWAQNEADWDTGSFEFFETAPCGPPPFFDDGFESGNLSAWTVVGPFAQ